MADFHTISKLNQELSKKISIARFEGDEKSWMGTEEAAVLATKIKAEEVQEKIAKSHAERLGTADTTDSGRKSRVSWLELFTTSSLGLGYIKKGRGKRDASKQSNFRSDIIKAYESRNPASNCEKLLWCPVLKDWVYEDNTTAGHIYAYKHGQHMMESIFGPEAKDELFSPRNGLIISNSADKVLDVGFFIIVPDIDDGHSKEEINAWYDTEPKDFKIQIIDWDYTPPDLTPTIKGEEKKGKKKQGDGPKTAFVDQFLNKEGLTWRQLHNTKVQFLNDFRPRSRYLYFLYCLQILRCAWRRQEGSDKSNPVTLKNEIGRQFWGTRGRYLPKHMLQAFIEELGNECDGLIDGSFEDERVQPKDITKDALMFSLAEQVKGGDTDEDSDEENSGSDDYDEDDEDE